jgi:hypothetical protein
MAELLSFAEYGRRCGVSRQVVFSWVKKKQIDTVKTTRTERRIRSIEPRPDVHAGRPRKDAS